MKFFGKIWARIKHSRRYQDLMSMVGFEPESSLLFKVHRLIQLELSTMAIHQKVFPQFKEINTGKDVVLFATGPSSRLYKLMPECVHIGVNQAYLRSDILFDYYFIHDNALSRCDGSNMIKAINGYRSGGCVKFYGLLTDLFLDTENPSWREMNFEISESDAIEAGAFRYRLDKTLMPNEKYEGKFAYDLSSQPLGDFGSVVFPAAQFALWTNPRRLYLVGCDCSAGGHFFDSGKTTDTEGYDFMIKPWCMFEKFARLYYPSTEVISVNPVGLKGIFRDIYTTEKISK